MTAASRRAALRAAILLAVCLAACGWLWRAVAARPQARPADDLARLRAQGYLVAAVPLQRPPFGWVEADGRPVGFDVDLARDLAVALIGREAKVRIAPLSAAAEADLVFGRTPGEGTTRAYYRGHLGLLVKRGAHIGSLRQIDGRVLGLVSGSPAEGQALAAAAKAGARPVPEIFTRYPLALAALGEGRIDALAGDAPVLYALRRLDPNTSVVATGFGDVAYAISAPPGLLPAVSSALDRLIADEPAWARRLRRWRLVR